MGEEKAEGQVRLGGEQGPLGSLPGVGVGEMLGELAEE